MVSACCRLHIRTDVWTKRLGLRCVGLWFCGVGVAGVADLELPNS